MDFICRKGRLVIEVEGAQHAQHQQLHDANRDEWLRTQGLR